MATETSTKKPHVRLTGTDGNVFFLLGKCARALNDAGQRDRAVEMYERVKSCHSYDEALQLMLEYVDAD
jgi:hypothetical protein